MRRHYDYLVVGAGFAGCVLAERLASQIGKTCLIVDRRAHSGGNANDHYNSHGVLVHRYGPHYFRTNSPRIVEYLSQFTDWHEVEYKILVWTEGRFWPFPINLNTFETLLGRASSTEEMEATLAQWRSHIDKPKNSEEVIVAKVGRQLFEKFYKNYTRKQWGRDAKDLDASVCARVPIRTNRDDRYLEEKFQAMPRMGYHKLFERMITHPNIQVLLRTDYRAVASQVSYSHLIFTGRIDEYYDCCYGPLPYRSLRFEHETFEANYVQPAVQINFPNEHAFTRSVEIKHVTGQVIPMTTVVREFPCACAATDDPYYPVPSASANRLYQKYAERAEKEARVSFIGRLATYRYYNMDQIVGMALAEFERLRQKHHAISSLSCMPFPADIRIETKL